MSTNHTAGPHIHKESVARGERGGLAKLTTTQVIEIWILRKTKQATLQALASRFGVSEPTISAIQAGRHWKHVTSKLNAAIVAALPQTTQNP